MPQPVWLGKAIDLVNLSNRTARVPEKKIAQQQRVLHMGRPVLRDNVCIHPDGHDVRRDEQHKREANQTAENQ